MPCPCLPLPWPPSVAQSNNTFLFFCVGLEVASRWATGWSTDTQGPILSVNCSFESLSIWVSVLSEKNVQLFLPPCIIELRVASKVHNCYIFLLSWLNTYLLTLIQIPIFFFFIVVEQQFSVIQRENELLVNLGIKTTQNEVNIRLHLPYIIVPFF